MSIIQKKSKGEVRRRTPGGTFFYVCRFLPIPNKEDEDRNHWRIHKFNEENAKFRYAFNECRAANVDINKMLGIK